MYRVQYNFEWNSEKALSNFSKHGVSFDEAATVFRDYNMISMYDNEHSEHEDIWISIGCSENSNILVVCHTFKEFGDKSSVIRIFSTRKATKAECKQYKG